MILSLIQFVSILAICVAQIDMYSSSFDQKNFAHRIEIENNNCILDQDEYAVYFWHRFSFTSPKYTENIQKFDLMRLTFNKNFQDQAEYEDRVIYVQSDGVSIDVYTHDTQANDKNVKKSINIKAYRYDMEWVFMFLQYRKPGQISIYIYFLRQKKELFAEITNIVHVKPTNYIGLFLGGDQFNKNGFSMNGQFYNPYILLDYMSQFKSLDQLKNIMREQPLNDYVESQFIFIKEDQKSISRIYTKFVLYGTVVSTNNASNNNKDLIIIDGSNSSSNAGKINSNIMKVQIDGTNNQLLFFSDDYGDLVLSSDNKYSYQIFFCDFVQDQELFYYIAVNMDDQTIIIYCNQSGISKSSGALTSRLFVPTNLAFTFLNTGANPDVQYIERSFLGGDYSTVPTDYMKMKTISDTNQFTSSVTLKKVRSFSICFWFRLFFSFPDENPWGNTIFTDDTKQQPLISLNLSPPSIDFSTATAGVENQYLAQGFLEGKQIKYFAYQKDRTNKIFKSDSDKIDQTWQWIATCLTYSDKSTPTDSQIKSYQAIGSKYSESYFKMDLYLDDFNLLTNFNVYIQLNFVNSYINRQYYNVVMNYAEDQSAYIEELVNFYTYIQEIPIRQQINKMLVSVLIPKEQEFPSLTPPVEFYDEGFNFALEYSLTFWVKIVSADRIIRMELSQQFTNSVPTFGNFFEISYDSGKIKLKSSSCNAELTSDPISPTNQYIFIYAGYSKYLKQIKLGVVYYSGPDMVRLNYQQDLCDSFIPLSKYHLFVDPTWSISDLRVNIGQYSYEILAFHENSIQGKWECSQKSKICKQPQTSSALFSKVCTSNYSLDSNTGECVPQCPCQQYGQLSTNNDKVCTNCNPLYCGFCVDVGNDKCTYCVSPLERTQVSIINEISVGTCECTKPGYVLINSSCVECDVKCLECQNTRTECTKCKRYTYLQDKECIPQDGYYFDPQGLIQPCDSSCKVCIDTNKCTKCFIEKQMELMISTNTCECTSRFTEVIDPVTSIKDCIACDFDSGYFKESKTQCTKCDPNCQLCENSSTNCTKCDNQKKLALNSVTNKCDCKQGYYLDGSNNCIQCDSSCIECTSSTFCTICTPDKIIFPIDLTNQKCVCDKNQDLFLNKEGYCKIPTFSASFSDYHSTSRTDTIYFSILFSQEAQLYQIDPAQFIKSVSLSNITSPISSQIIFPSTSQTNQVIQRQNQYFKLKLVWINPKEISVEMQFFNSFMNQNLQLEFSNRKEFYVKNSNEFLITQTINMQIKLIVHQSKSSDFSLISDLIDAASIDNSFLNFIVKVFRSTYAILLLYPFMQVNLILLTLNTVLPPNFYYFLRMFTHFTLIGDLPMQQENSQVEFLDYFFLSLDVPIKDFQANLNPQLCSLNFVNSSVVMAGTTVLFIVILQLAYYWIKQYYLKQDGSDNGNGHHQSKQLRIIHLIFRTCNNLSSLLLEATFFYVCCAVAMNIKSQYMIYTLQIIGYIMSIGVIWGFSLYLCNLSSIFINRLHQQMAVQFKLYQNYFIQEITLPEIQENNSSETEMNYSSNQITFVIEEKKLIVTEQIEEKIPIMTRIKGFKNCYHFINLIRKCLIAAFILVLSDHFLGQIIPYLIFQILLIVYTILLFPYKNLILNVIKIIAEVSLLVVIIVIMISREYERSLQSDYKKSFIPNDKMETFFTQGNVLIAFFSIYMFFHLIISSYKFITYFSGQKEVSQKQENEVSNSYDNSNVNIIKQAELVQIQDQSVENRVKSFRVEGYQNQRQQAKSSIDFYCELEPKYSKNYFKFKNKKL